MFLISQRCFCWDTCKILFLPFLFLLFLFFSPSSLFPLPSSLSLSLSLSPSLRPSRACAHYRSFVFFAVTSVTGDSNGLWFSELWVYLGLCSCLPYFLCGVCAKNHSKHTKFLHPFSTNLRKLIKKQSVDWRKTTRRFWKVTRCFSENDLSFFEKWPVVFCKSTCCFMKRKCTLFFSVVTLVTAKNAKSLVIRVCAYTRVRARKCFWQNGGGTPNSVAPKCQSCFGENDVNEKVTLTGFNKHYAFYCCSQTYLIAKLSIY